MTYNSVCRAAPGKGSGSAPYISVDHNNIHLQDYSYEKRSDGQWFQSLKVHCEDAHPFSF